MYEKVCHEVKYYKILINAMLMRMNDGICLQAMDGSLGEDPSIGLS